eukprot:GFKZ01010021.1.p1 GENE.GFKZ01010021.1~~GFKZ01010021.1.p1  ORF type:complete len:505 (-),score=45.52 GFKZ01010021.1:106-1464(-)
MSEKLPPGSSGLPIIGETPAFLRDFFGFCNDRIRNYGPIFRTHLLSLPTVMTCSYESTLRVLCSDTKTSSFEAAAAYSEFLNDVYPKPNLLTSDEASPARRIASSFLPLLSEPALVHYEDVSDRVIQEHLRRLRLRIAQSSRGALAFRPYAFFKTMCEEITIRIVLGTIPPGLYKRVRQLCSDHFNGVVAVPVSLSMFGRQTARAKGIRGFKQLEEILENLVRTRATVSDSRKECVMDVVIESIREKRKRLDRELQEHIVQFLLVLLSTAIPKSLASCLASTVREGSKDRRRWDMLAGQRTGPAMLEFLRLWPPMMGGMRISGGENVEIGEHVISGPCRVWYSIWHSNRDEKEYERGTEFRPERWANLAPSKCPFGGMMEADGPRLPFTFGAGARMCAGKDIAWMVLCNAAQSFCQNFVVDAKHSSASMRYFPVLREEEDPALNIRLNEAVQ